MTSLKELEQTSNQGTNAIIEHHDRPISVDVLPALQSQQLEASFNLAWALTQELGRKPTEAELGKRLLSNLKLLGYNQPSLPFEINKKFLGISEPKPQTIEINDHSVKLTRTEYQLFQKLVIHCETPVEFGRLIAFLNQSMGEHTLQVHMNRLKGKLRFTPAELAIKIRRIRGVGYILEKAKPASPADLEEYPQDQTPAA